MSSLQRDIEAVNPFLATLVALDSALTGKPYEECWRNRPDSGPTTVQQWFESMDVYYLSDGGYSRLGCNWDTARLFLTSNSLDPAKAAFQQHPALVSRLEEIILDGLRKMDSEFAASVEVNRVQASS